MLSPERFVGKWISGVMFARKQETGSEVSAREVWWRRWMNAGWTPPDVQIRPILLLQSALFLSPVKVAAVFDEVQFHKSVQFNLEILAENKNTFVGVLKSDI